MKRLQQPAAEKISPRFFAFLAQGSVIKCLTNVTTLKYLSALLGIGWLAAACGLEDNRPADWDYIAPAIIIPNCATSSCHSKATAASGLDMSTPDKAYKSLTGLEGYTQYCGADNGDGEGPDAKRCGEKTRRARPLITPRSPSQSRTVNMMRARGAERMPPDRPLAEADIALFEQWILEGAEQ